MAFRLFRKRPDSVLELDAPRRIREKFSKLIWDQVRPWAYFEIEGLRVSTFDGTELVFAPRPHTIVELQPHPAKEIFWDGKYIQPFIEAICHEELATATEWVKATRASPRKIMQLTRCELIEGIIRTFFVMADVHRTQWPRQFVTRRDTSKEVNRMVDFLDQAIRSILYPPRTPRQQQH